MVLGHEASSLVAMLLDLKASSLVTVDTKAFVVASSFATVASFLASLATCKPLADLASSVLSQQVVPS